MRWVVEAVHGILGQKYKLLHHQLDNKLLPTIRTYFRIACFLNNKFGKRLDSDSENKFEILKQIESQSSVENTLANIIETENWNRKRVIFQQLSSRDLNDFPEMTENDLKVFFTGSYQLSQAISYLAEMMDEENNILLHYVKQQPNIVKFQVKSRHINAKTYKCYVEYAPNTIGVAGIKRYCCECANGRRTMAVALMLQQ